MKANVHPDLLPKGGSASRDVLILGIGNILWADEGFGPRAAEAFHQRYETPAGVDVMDGGTLGIRLMDAIMGCDLLIVVDAVLGGGEPGTLYRLEGEGLRESMSFRDSMHQTDLVDTLIYCDLAGHRPDAVVIGMEPADYHTMEIGLTPVCQARLPDLAGKVVVLRRRGGRKKEIFDWIRSGLVAIIKCRMSPHESAARTHTNVKMTAAAHRELFNHQG